MMNKDKTKLNITASMIAAAHDAALAAAKIAGQEFLDKHYGGNDWGACGFAWAKTYADGRTRFAKDLQKIAKFSSSYSGGYDLWNPSGLNCQNIDAKEAGARKYAKVMNEMLGIPENHVYRFFSGSRMD